MKRAKVYTDGHARACKAYVYLISVIAAVGGFLFGYDLAVISGAMIYVEKYFALNPVQMGFAVSCAMLGCMVGPIVGGSLSDRLGRKKVLMLSAVLFGVGAIGTAIPRNILEFNVFRIVGGVGVGLASVVSPMYIAEVAPARARGGLVTLNQLAIVLGAIGSYAVCYSLSLSGGPDIWRWMFALECVPVLVSAVGLIFVPESPRWLVQKNRKTEALAVLAQIDGEENAQVEMREISDSVSGKTCTFSELFRRGIRLALVIAVGLAFFQQYTGASPIGIYLPIIFQKAGFAKTSDALLQSMLVMIWNLVCTVFSIWIVDRFGRRPLLLWGIACMCLGLIGMGMCFHLGISGFCVVAIMFFTSGAYSLSLAPLAWLIIAEIFPTWIRGRAMAAASVVLWVSAYSATQLVPSMIAHFEKAYGTGAGVFWSFGGICVLAFVFVWRMVPETKGKTLEQIAKLWARA